jgi:hypothetical protein
LHFLPLWHHWPYCVSRIIYNRSNLCVTPALMDFSFPNGKIYSTLWNYQMTVLLQTLKISPKHIPQREIYCSLWNSQMTVPLQTLKTFPKNIPEREIFCTSWNSLMTVLLQTLVLLHYLVGQEATERQMIFAQSSFLVVVCCSTTRHKMC